jgi:hypothetical protein
MKRYFVYMYIIIRVSELAQNVYEGEHYWCDTEEDLVRHKKVVADREKVHENRITLVYHTFPDELVNRYFMEDGVIRSISHCL